ncbi:MAG TPA: zf-HC2 domain-containing protein, partial [Patescibacteria group bacterium]|nr:zf-HC2 domain-containing protein [Patescibacteria group bacterium]
MPRPDECHHPANGLLPWYAKGTLQGAELEWVKDHVESCDSCSYEFESLTAPAVNEPEQPRTPAPANPSRRSLLLVGALV